MKNSTSTLDHLNFTVADFEESVNWYREIFNFELVEQGTSSDGHRWGILRSGDSLLAITEYREKQLYSGDKYHQYSHFGLRLEDRRAWEETLRKHQLPTYYSSPIDYPHSVSWYVKDPTGNEIEVAIWNENKVRFS